MRVIRVLITFLSLSAVSAHADDRLDQLFAGTEITPSLSGLQVATMRGGKPTDSFAFGMAQISAEGTTPLTSDHKIRVASISKMVMAIGFMQLVETGKLDLDSNVSDVVGFPLENPNFPTQKITARQLLSHTSSLRDADQYWLPAGTHIRSFFESDGDNFDDGGHFADHIPGAYFNYANINFGVLASMMEIASGERFDRYMKQHVLQPLGLTASYNACDIPEELRAAAFRKRGPEGWNPKGPWVSQVDGGEPVCFYGMPADEAEADAFAESYVLGSNGTLFSPQGGLRASANDLMVILQMIAGGGELNGKRILSEASVQELLRPEWVYDPDLQNGNTTGEGEPGGPTEGLMTSYGLSVHRIDLKDWGLTEGVLIGHLGEAYGVLSHAFLDPTTGEGVATILTGTADDSAGSPTGASPLYRIEEELLKWWLSQR